MVHFRGSTAVVGQGLLITDVSRSNSVGFLRTSHRDLYMATHNTHNWQTFTPRRDSNPQSQQASGRAAIGIGLRFDIQPW